MDIYKRVKKSEMNGNRKKSENCVKKKKFKFIPRKEKWSIVNSIILSSIVFTRTVKNLLRKF